MHSFKPATRGVGRVPRFLLASLLILTAWGVNPAHADGVNSKITSGKSVTGTITSGTDSYSFKVDADSSFVVSVSETGVHDANFIPMIGLVAPNGNVRGHGAPLYSMLRQSHAAEGIWTVNVSRAHEGGPSGGSYALTLIQLPGAVGGSGGLAGGTLSAGAASGSNVRGQVDVWQFSGVAGHTSTLSLAATGGQGFYPEIVVFAPGGALLGGSTCPGHCSQDVSIAATGTYTVLVDKADYNDVTGTYTLSVNDRQ